MTREAIVIGAGIIGLASARALEDAGWRVRILEAAPEIRTEGAGITLATNGLSALDALGVGERVRETGAHAPLQGQFTLHGTRLTGAAETSAGTVVGIHRSTLSELLREGLDAEIQTDARVARVVPGARPRVVLANDDELDADLVVGADGIDSVARRAIDNRVRPDYSGATAWRGVVQAISDSPEGATVWFGRGSEAGIVPIDGGRVYWYVSVRARAGGKNDPELDAVRAYVDNWQSPVRDHIAATAEHAVQRHDLRYLPTGLQSFVGEGVVLVGDAAHAMMPSLGQGASIGFEDAAVLGLLAAEGELDAAALERYDRLRRPRAQRIQRRSNTMFRFVQGSSSRLHSSLRNLKLSLAPMLALEVAAGWLLEWTPSLRDRR